MAAIRSSGVTPAIVDQEVLDDIRGGTIECVPAVGGLDGDGVALAVGRSEPADAGMLMAGYDQTQRITTAGVRTDYDIPAIVVERLAELGR